MFTIDKYKRGYKFTINPKKWFYRSAFDAGIMWKTYLGIRRFYFTQIRKKIMKRSIV